jgi:chemosensory pili system protein ChpC
MKANCWRTSTRCSEKTKLHVDKDTVQCLALPIVGGQILIPSAVVAEVYAMDAVSPATGGPDWLLGNIIWRGSELPLVCMEAALGAPRLEAGIRSKAVVMKAQSASETLKHFAVLVQGIPHQVLATGHSVAPEIAIDGPRPFVAMDLQVEGEQAFIPDMDAVEKALLDAVDQWRAREPAGSDRDDFS